MTATSKTFDFSESQAAFEVEAGPKFFLGDMILNLPRTEWLIESCVQKGGMTVIWGKPQHGKSLITVGWACTLGSGLHRWMGQDIRHNNSKSGKIKVGYIAAEGVRGMIGRVSAWMDAHNLDPEVEGWPAVYWSDGGITFWRKPDQDQMSTQQADFLHKAAEHELDVVIVDTMARTFGGGNENTQQDMNMYLEYVSKLQELGIAVVVVHHANKGSEMRGSTVLEGFADTVFSVEAETAGGKYHHGSLNTEKQKDGPSIGVDGSLHFVPHEYSDPDFNQPSLALVRGTATQARENKIEDAVLEVLSRQPLARSKLYNAMSFRTEDIKQAIADLVNLGKVVDGGHGKPLSLADAEDVEEI